MVNVEIDEVFSVETVHILTFLKVRDVYYSALRCTQRLNLVTSTLHVNYVNYVVFFVPFIDICAITACD